MSIKCKPHEFTVWEYKVAEAVNVHGQPLYSVRVTTPVYTWVSRLFGGRWERTGGRLRYGALDENGFAVESVTPVWFAERALAEAVATNMTPAMAEHRCDYD